MNELWNNGNKRIFDKNTRILKIFEMFYRFSPSSQTREFFRAKKKKKNLSIEVENDSAHTHPNGKYTKSPVFKFQTAQISKRKQTSFYRGRKYSVTVLHW